MDSIPAKRRSGIYCILNRETLEAYVGKASDFTARKDTHFYKLRRGEHHSKTLQASYDKYGRKAFAFNVLEECPPDELDAKEHDWILRIRPVFNGMIPDYLAVAKGKKPDGRLRRRKGIEPGTDPGRHICACGNLKVVTSRACLACMKELAAKMVADGYLPASHRFSWQQPRYYEPTHPKRLPQSDKYIRQRVEYAKDRCVHARGRGADYAPEDEADEHVRAYLLNLVERHGENIPLVQPRPEPDWAAIKARVKAKRAAKKVIRFARALLVA